VLDQTEHEPKPPIEALGKPELFSRVCALVLKYINTRGWERFDIDLVEEANDLTAEALGRAYKFYDGFRGDCMLSTWVFKIALGLAKKGAKKLESRWRTVPTVPLAEWLVPARATDLGGMKPLEPADNRTEPQERLDTKLTEEALARALERLRPDHRDMLLGFAWDDLSYEQLAEIHGITIQAVKSRMNRARQRLKELVRGTPAEDMP